MSPIDVASLGDYIREQRGQAEMSLRQLAERAGVSNPYLSQIERGVRKPSAEILSQIAKGLRISAETLYVRAGILEDHRGDVNTAATLLADQTITDRQRQVLLEIYAAFQTENAVTLPGNVSGSDGGPVSASDGATTVDLQPANRDHQDDAFASRDA
ncbi:MAG: transcriptional regulator with XRE-family HTH domain [Actinomycetes bacterium]|jgi:transcriptional regulator with XRE-family HTH domain